jgi:hypothetical protein
MANGKGVMRDEWFSKYICENKGKELTLDEIYNEIPKTGGYSLCICSKFSLSQVLRKYRLKRQTRWDKRRSGIVVFYRL